MTVHPAYSAKLERKNAAVRKAAAEWRDAYRAPDVFRYHSAAWFRFRDAIRNLNAAVEDTIAPKWS